MKSVLISIKPQWCELIASGAKTVEVRKTRPKLETPFKVYIYCTIDGGVKGDILVNSRLICGKVIGEFVCDKIVKFENAWDDPAFDETSKLSCIRWHWLARYLGENEYGYGWNITDLVIYDKPRELSEFKKPCTHKNDCCTCDRYDYIGHRCYDDITRPFQSWGYVESEDAK